MALAAVVLATTAGLLFWLQAAQRTLMADAVPAAPPADAVAAAAPGVAGAGLPAGTPPASAHGVDGMDAELVAAIVVATLVHKAKRRQEAAPVMRTYWPGSLLYASRWLASGRMRQNISWQRRGR